MATPKIIIADKVYIPAERITSRKAIKKGFERRLYQEKACSKCKNKPERFNEICATCPAFLGHYKTWREEKVKGKPYVSLPVGNWELIEKHTGIDLYAEVIDDQRSDVKAKHPLTFTGRLYDGTEVINGIEMTNQKKLVKKFWQAKSGLLKAAPGTGKTMMAVRLICAYKRRVLVVAHERILLKQFLTALRKNTNIKQLEKETGEKIAGILQYKGDLEAEWDIVLCTYQRFIREDALPQINKYLRHRFGLVVVDEVHRGNADAYARFINMMDTKYQIGLTATEERKDRKQFLIDQIIGPVVAEATTRSLTPQVELLATKIDPQREWRGQTGYLYATQWLAENKERNAIIVRQVFKDLRSDPRHNIIIPCLYVGHVHKLVRMINRQARINNQKRGENWGAQLALPLLGAPNMSKQAQDATIKAARESEETRVVVSIVKKCREGTDVPPWSIMYLQIPMNNETNFFQMTQRICRPLPGKPTPILRMFVDSMGLSQGCFAATWQHGVVKQKYYTSVLAREQAYAIMEQHRDKRGGERRGWDSGAPRVGGAL